MPRGVLEAHQSRRTGSTPVQKDSRKRRKLREVRQRARTKVSVGELGKGDS
jgi:hypothetical protein